MVNINGIIKEPTFTIQNRAFKYADAVFETIKVRNEKIVFSEDHYFRLMASMRMLRMEIPMNFTQDFFEEEISKIIKHQGLTESAVRFTVFRDGGGLYVPETNSINFCIEARALNKNLKEVYEVDIFKDFYIYSGLLSTIKTTQKLTHVLAGIYAKENDFDNCILVNESKNIVEAINGNIFIVKGSIVITPPISDGCIKGIARKKILEIIKGYSDIEIVEESISPFDLQKVDEVFISNAIVGIQSVTKFRKREFTSNSIAERISADLEALV